MTGTPSAFEALTVRPGALERGGTEVVRAVIVEGGLDISLRRGFDDVAVWGVLLADVARHVARLFAMEDGISQTVALDAMRSMLEAELDRPTDPGTTSAVS
jgi:Domain of unknown function (DUF5076)